MDINHAILGILSERSLTGYDLKKIIQDSPILPWSGNNNQIYKSLVELLEEGFVTNEVQHQESLPTKKIYTITEQGLSELRKGTLACCEPPEFKKMALAQLAYAHQLTNEELNSLLINYENEITAQLKLQEERMRREEAVPGRNARDLMILGMIRENTLAFYKNELQWVQKLREAINENQEEIR